MELEALGGISGEVLDIGCGLGDNAIFLASRGHSVTGLDGSPAAIEQARAPRREPGRCRSVTFDVADATNLTGYDGRFDTVVDSALYHCLDDDGRQAYAAGLYRATRPGARWHLYCFSDGNINGIIAPMGSVPESEHPRHADRERLAHRLPRSDNLSGEHQPDSAAVRGRLTASDGRAAAAEAVEQMQDVRARFNAIADLLDDDRVYLPFTVVHAHRVD